MLAIYMVGSDLEDRFDAGTDDLWELIDGYDSLPDKQEIEVVVAFGGANKDSWRGMKFANMLQIIADSQDSEFGDETGASAYLQRYDNANMDAEESLKLFLDYIRDGYTNFDARFLTLWDHGNSYRGFGGDTNFNNGPMSMDEMRLAFERSGVGRFDLIGFDACLMASVEVAKVIAPNADYMIASEAVEPGHGWLWSDVIRLYAEEDSIEEAGKQMVDSYVDNHDGIQDFYPLTLSLLNLSQYDQLVTALNPMILAYGQNLSDNEYADSLIGASSYHIESYGGSRRDGEPPVSVDLMHFAQLLAEDPPDSDTSAKLNKLMDAIDNFVVHSRHDSSRPNSHGIAIDAPENTKSDYDSYKISSAWLDFQASYEELRQDDTSSPQIVASDSDADPQSLQFAADVAVPSDTGLAATFDDDNLAVVTALYGFVKPVEFDDGTVDDYFMVVAEVEAYPTETEGEYFIPEWDQRWFTVEYDPNEITAWIPAAFVGWFEEDGQEYTIYEAEIDFYPADEDIGSLAVLTLVADEYMEVVYHHIQTYQQFDDGSIRFDKATYEIIPGDAIQFYNFGFHLADESQDDWFETGEGIVTFVQEPVFQLELLEFEDSSGQLYEYQYGMWAEDASGNGTFYLPDADIPLAAESPSWETLVYEDQSRYFEVDVPASWVEEQPDASVDEVFVAFDTDGNGAVSIRIEEYVQESLTEYADLVESWIIDEDGENITITYIDEFPEFIYEYSLGNSEWFGLVHLSDNAILVDIIYAFPDDLYDAGAEIAYYSFGTFWFD